MMDNKEYVICDKEDLVAIADAVRAKNGSSDTLAVEELPSAINGIVSAENLDEEIAEQEEKIASQDGLIADIVAALEGKVAGGSGEISFETSTVNVYDLNGLMGCICVSVYRDGQIFSKKYPDPIEDDPYTTSVIIENVIKGSYITIVTDNLRTYNILGATEISFEETYDRPGMCTAIYRIDASNATIGLGDEDETLGGI